MAMKDISDELVCKAYILREKVKNAFPKLSLPIYPYHILEGWTDQPLKVCYRAMERAADRDYIEYGVSLRTGWVTDKGLALLK